MAPDQPWPKRLHLLDLSRTGAALAVVLWHWPHFAYVGDRPPAGFDYTAQPLYGLLRLFYEHGHWAVDYFFQLSGFIFFWLYRDAIAARAVTAWPFFVQRFSRLYPLHLATLILVAVLQAAYTRTTGAPFVYQQNDAYHFLLHLTFTNLRGLEYNWAFNGPAWSITIEVLLYGCFFLCAVARLARPVFCAGVTLAFAWLWLGRDWPHEILRGLASFFAGGLVWMLTRALARGPARGRYAACAIALGAWAAAVVSVYHAPLFSPLAGRWLAWGVLFPATITALALCESPARLPLHPALGLGDISYGIYLLHFPLQLIAMLLVAFGLIPSDFFQHPAGLGLFLLLLLVAARASYQLYELPARRWLRQRLVSRGG